MMKKRKTVMTKKQANLIAHNINLVSAEGIDAYAYKTGKDWVVGIDQKDSHSNEQILVINF